MVNNFFNHVGTAIKQSVTTGSKYNRAESGLADASLGLVIVGGILCATGIGAVAGSALISLGVDAGVASSSMEFGEGAYEYTHGNKSLGAENMVMGSLGIGLSILDVGSVAAEVRGFTTASRVMGGVATGAGLAMSGVGLYVGIKSNNDLEIAEAGLGLGLAGIGLIQATARGSSHNVNNNNNVDNDMIDKNSIRISLTGEPSHQSVRTENTICIRKLGGVRDRNSEGEDFDFYSDPGPDKDGSLLWAYKERNFDESNIKIEDKFIYHGRIVVKIRYKTKTYYFYRSTSISAAGKQEYTPSDNWYYTTGYEGKFLKISEEELDDPKRIGFTKPNYSMTDQGGILLFKFIAHYLNKNYSANGWSQYQILNNI